MAVGEEELERFERDAEQGGGSKSADGDAPPAVASSGLLVSGKSRIRSIQATVSSRQSEEAKDKEEQSRKDSKDWEVAEVAVPIGPRSEPIWDEREFSHVRRWRERTHRDGREQGERKRDGACSKDDT